MKAKDKLNKIKSKFFTINKLLNIFKKIEHYCWSSIKENINEQYKAQIDENVKNQIIQFFKEYNSKNDKLITKDDLAAALRRLISRYLAGKRGDTDINENQELISQIIKQDLWDYDILKNEEIFQREIYSLTFELKVSQAFEYYAILGGDSFDFFDKRKNIDDICLSTYI